MIGAILLRRDVQFERLRSCVKDANFLMQLCMEMERLGDNLDQKSITRNFFAVYELLVHHCGGRPCGATMSVFDDTVFSHSLNSLTSQYIHNVPSTTDLDDCIVGNGGMSPFFVPNSKESIAAAFRYGLQWVKIDIYWSEMDGIFYTTHQKESLDCILEAAASADGNAVTLHWMAKSFDGEKAAKVLHRSLSSAKISANVLCGNEYAIRDIRRQSVSLELGYITSNIQEDCFRSMIDTHSLYCVCLDYTTVCPMVVEKVHEMGCKVYCTGADSTNEKLYLKACNVDLMITDFPLKGRSCIYV